MNAHPKRVKRRGSRFGVPARSDAPDLLARRARVAKRGCPGHVASKTGGKVCDLCGTHVDEYRDEPEEL
jgi:hypothetical protein